jgi:hypothetical protein
MAIRSKNIDFESDQMKLSSQLLMDLTATVTVPCFVAPYACEVKSVSLVPSTGNTFNSSQTNTVTVRQISDSDASLQVRTTALSAGVRNLMTPSANNSLSTGAALEIQYSATCQTLGTVLVEVKYVPLTHREST